MIVMCITSRINHSKRNTPFLFSNGGGSIAVAKNYIGMYINYHFLLHLGLEILVPSIINLLPKNNLTFFF